MISNKKIKRYDMIFNNVIAHQGPKAYRYKEVLFTIGLQ